MSDQEARSAVMAKLMQLRPYKILTSANIAFAA